MPTESRGTGVTDSAAGSGIHQYLGFRGPGTLPDALSQAVTLTPMGDMWSLRAIASFTPPLCTVSLPPTPVLSYRVPTDRFLLLDGGFLHNYAADETFMRVCRRYLFRGYQAQASLAAQSVPSVGLQAADAGIASSGTFSWKVSQVDMFGRESGLTAASANLTLTATQQVASVTPTAILAGAVRSRIYRSLAGQNATGPWYFVGEVDGFGTLLDAMPDSVASTRPQALMGVAWATGAVAGETADGPCEVIYEVGPQALTGAPTAMVYTNQRGIRRATSFTAPGTAVGTRHRVLLSRETLNFVTTPTASANLWRGPSSEAGAFREVEDTGATAVLGVNAAPTVGAYALWGQQTVAMSDVPVIAGQFNNLRVNGTVLFPPSSELVVELGNLLAAAVGVREVNLFGRLLPTALTS